MASPGGESGGAPPRVRRVHNETFSAIHFPGGGWVIIGSLGTLAGEDLITSQNSSKCQNGENNSWFNFFFSGKEDESSSLFQGYKYDKDDLGSLG